MKEQENQQDSQLQAVNYQQEGNASQQQVQRKPNKTGIPDRLKAVVEHFSGLSLDEVRVHYNSDKPAEIGALAYAEYPNIYIAPGEEKHLAEEVWHIVQQMKGEAKANTTFKGGKKGNNEDKLEKEAQEKGDKLEQTTIPSKEQDTSPVEPFSPQPLAQRAETLAENISRILLNRGIQISDEEADAYAEAIEKNPANTEIQVHGRHRALKRDAAGRLSSIKRRPPSGATHMRADAYAGPMKEEDSSMIMDGRFPMTGAVMQQDVTITADDLKAIPPRGDLRAEMGGSAAQMSGISNSEWLHAVAHSLGGADKNINLAAGPHSLNTAMIPFEVAVKTLVYNGIAVHYSVTFFTDFLENGFSYIHGVEVGIKTRDDNQKYWTLRVSEERRDQFINGGVLADIQKIANQYLESADQ